MPIYNIIACNFLRTKRAVNYGRRRTYVLQWHVLTKTLRMSNEAKLRHNALSAVCDYHFSLMRCVSGLSRSLRTGLSPCERELCSPFSFLFCFRSASENLRKREEQASTYIQSRWRSYNTRNNFERLKTAVLSIHAGYRGHLGRKRALCRSHLVSS